VLGRSQDAFTFPNIGKKKQPRVHARMKNARSTLVSGWLNKWGHTPRKATLVSAEVGQRERHLIAEKK
jgi:hypothetical protein